MPSIYETYFRDPLYFQRMLEFLLHARFRAVRIYFPEKRKEECVFFAVDGTLVDVQNNKRRFKTLTDWYNAVYKTNHDMYFTGIFSKIHISQRINLNEILQSISSSEIAEFHDVKYRSNLAYNYIFRRLRAHFIECDWEKKQDYVVEWKGHSYTVSSNHTYSTGGNVNKFLGQFVGSKEVVGLQICLTDGTRRNLVDPVESKEVKDVESKEEVPRESILEEMLRTEISRWQETIHSITEEQARVNEENQAMRQELEDMKKQMQDMSMQLQTVSMHCTHLLGVVGTMLPPTPIYIPQPPVSPVFYPHQVFPPYTN